MINHLCSNWQIILHYSYNNYQWKRKPQMEATVKFINLFPFKKNIQNIFKTSNVISLIHLEQWPLYHIKEPCNSDFAFSLIYSKENKVGLQYRPTYSRSIGNQLLARVYCSTVAWQLVLDRPFINTTMIPVELSQRSVLWNSL